VCVCVCVCVCVLYAAAAADVRGLRPCMQSNFLVNLENSVFELWCKSRGVRLVNLIGALLRNYPRRLFFLNAQKWHLDASAMDPFYSFPWDVQRASQALNNSFRSSGTWCDAACRSQCKRLHVTQPVVVMQEVAHDEARRSHYI